MLPALPPGALAGRYVAMPDVDAAVAAYRRWLHDDPDGRQVAQEAKIALRGRHLACWFRLDSPCHAQVLLELVND